MGRENNGREKMREKLCRRCNVTKPRAHFVRYDSKEVRQICNECAAATKRDLYVAIRERKRAIREAHPGYIADVDDLPTGEECTEDAVAVRRARGLHIRGECVREKLRYRTIAEAYEAQHGR